MDMYRFTSKSPIETTDGNYAPTGLVVEFPCYGPSDLDVEKKIKPKSVIRISLCRKAKRNPLIFPI